jgi:predicted dienelactone hydrolase
MLMMAGTADQSTPIDPNLTRPWELAASTDLYRVELADAGHQSFTDLCDYQAFLPTLPTEVPAAVVETIDQQATDGCSPANMPIERAKELTNTFAVAFLESVFRDGEMIDPAAAMPPDVVYLQR